MAAKTWSRTVGTANWSDGTNWNGGTVPATTDAVTFNGTSVLNCTADALGTWSGGTLTITNAYSGVITKNVAMTTAAFSIAGGTWTDGSTNLTVTTFTISGGAFTATSGTLQCSSNFTKSGSPVFTHNSGTVKFAPAGTTPTLDASGVTFNLVTFTAASGTAGMTIANGTTAPLGNSPSWTTSGNATITINGAITVGTGTWTIVSSGGSRGSLSVSSTGSVTGLSNLSITGDVTVNSAATFPANVTATWKPVGARTVDATAVTWGTWTVSVASGTGGCIIGVGTTIPLGASPTVTMGGNSSFTVNGTITVASGSLTVKTSAGSTSSFVVSSGATVTGVTTLITPGGVSVSSGATWPANVAIQWGAGATAASVSIDVPSSAFTLGTCSIGATTSTPDLSIAVGTVFPLGNNPSLTIGAGSVTVNGTITASGTVSFSGSAGSIGTLSIVGIASGFTDVTMLHSSLSVDPASSIPASLNVEFQLTTNNARSFSGGSKSYGTFLWNLVSGSGTGTLTISGSNTFTSFTNSGTLTRSMLVTAGTTQTAATWSLGGISGHLLTLASTVGGSIADLRCSTGGSVVSCDYLTVTDIRVDGPGTVMWFAGANSTHTGILFENWQWYGSPTNYDDYNKGYWFPVFTRSAMGVGPRAASRYLRIPRPPPGRVVPNSTVNLATGGMHNAKRLSKLGF